MRTLYSFFIQVLAVLIPIAGIFHSKARLWSQGRRQWRNRLSDWRKGNPGELIWMHCASLGEFEQGRPVLEALRARCPHKKLLLTFFSPSGFQVRKHYSGVDGVFYLPADTTANARDFLAIVKPSRAMMVKYEYWPNFFLSCKQQHVPLYIVSGIFRPDQRFFGMFSSFWRPVLAAVNHFFVQNESSVRLLESIGFTNVTLAGDTRFDRVMQLKQSPRAVEWIRAFKGEGLLVVGGSTWPADEEVLAHWFDSAPADSKLVVVPHEVGIESNLRLKKLFNDAILWSQCKTSGTSPARVLIVDEIGWLSSIYAHADVCWIGGGFGAGIHNTLEAAVWKKPVLFGPRYLKFDEACGLISSGGAMSAKDSRVGSLLLQQLTRDAALREQMGQQAGLCVERGTGATQKILSVLSGK